MSDITYTAVATSTAEGRNGGRATSDDGVLDVSLAVPKALGGAGGGTNPEQLFAAGGPPASSARSGGSRKAGRPR